MVVINHAGVVGSEFHLTTEERDNGLGIIVGHIGEVEAVEQLCLLLVEH